VADELRTELDATGQRIVSRARSRAPVYHGKQKRGVTPGLLRSTISYKVLPKTLKMKAGIVGKIAGKKAYYARWVEFGHRIARGGRLAKQEPIKGYSTAAKIQRLKRKSEIRRTGVPPHPFLYTFTRAELYQPFQKVWGRAIHKAAAGASNE
jgi:hypothetical protein